MSSNPETKRTGDTSQSRYVVANPMASVASVPVATPVASSIKNLFKAAANADAAISAASKMPGGSTKDDFVKNLFKTVQGVEYVSRCPHGLPYYACMSCSH